MTSTESLPLSVLYESDETAWLELMASHAEAGRYEELDLPNLSEFLSAMAKRDRREVLSRLVVLLVHLLKWEYQPSMRSVSWQLTIAEQRRQLASALDSGVLRNHAENVLAQAFMDAVEEASLATKLPKATFPNKSPINAKAWVALPVPADDEE